MTLHTDPAPKNEEEDEKIADYNLCIEAAKRVYENGDCTKEELRKAKIACEYWLE